MKHPIPTIEEFRQAVIDGWVREYHHKTLPLVGFVYSFKCEMEGHWDNITRYARGIVFDENGNLIAFPFPKFFNLNQHEETKIENLPNLPFTITTKEDGSLIIVFNYDGHWIVSTKGSFHSEQANWGHNFLSVNMLFDLFNTIGKDNTYLFEGIYPANRIVVDYGSFEGLKFLGSFCRSTKSEITDSILPNIKTHFPIANSHSFDLNELFSLCKVLKGTEQEGFVIRYSNGLRVKIKGDDYCALHKIITNATPLSVWESLDKLESLDKIPGIKKNYIESIPDEFLPKILMWETELKLQYQRFLDKAKDALEDAKKQGFDRKTICIHLSKNHKEVMPFAISLMDNRVDRLDDSIKNRIRPTANKFDIDQRKEILGEKNISIQS